jgi:hypothetical protein
MSFQFDRSLRTISTIVVQRGLRATKFGMISRKGAKTQRKRNPIFRTSRPFDAAQDMLGVLAGETPKSE